MIRFLCIIAQIILFLNFIVGIFKPSAVIRKELPIKLPKRLVIIVGYFVLAYAVGYITPAPATEEENKTEQVEELTPQNIRTSCQASVIIYLERTLNDADSYEDVGWGKVEETELGYTITHTFRAKNGFGAKILNTKTFYLNKQFIVTNMK